jgi:hypothetical protein
MRNSEDLVVASEHVDVPRQAMEIVISFEVFRATPSNDAEAAAKFVLYESFAKACEKIRDQVFGFYQANKGTLGPRVCAAMSKTLADIDRAENLGTDDSTDETTWFVFEMAKKVDANSTRMTSILSDFGRRLELLAAADQSCPVCLENFEPQVRANSQISLINLTASAKGSHSTHTALSEFFPLIAISRPVHPPFHSHLPPHPQGARAAEVLGCCHCVCADCWGHIETLARGQPLCPLCRREEFMMRLADPCRR